MATEYRAKMTVEGADKAAGDVKKVGDAAKETEQAIDGSNDAAKDLTGSLDNMTGGAIAGLQGMVGGVKKGVMAMKTLRGAVMATGIGALVVIIGSSSRPSNQVRKGPRRSTGSWVCWVRLWTTSWT